MPKESRLGLPEVSGNFWKIPRSPFVNSAMEFSLFRDPNMCIFNSDYTENKMLKNIFMNYDYE
jgi:hypothetical protein